MRSSARLRTTRIRNFGVIAHVDAGKTTVSERILYLTGRIHRIGEVHHGDAALDHTAIERDRGITISSAATTVTWRDHRLNLVDTPGHVDFGAEVERSLRVLDGAVTVLDAVAGVEPQTEAVWRQADAHRLPRLVVVNKLDRPGADLDRCVAELADTLDTTPLVTQVPVVDAGHRLGLVDLVEGRWLRWGEDDPASLRADPIPDHLAGTADDGRTALIETVAELDDELLDAYLHGPVDPSTLRAAIRRVTVSARAVPVLAASALRGIGIQPVLDAIVDWLPAPGDRPLPGGIRAGGQADSAVSGDLGDLGEPTEPEGRSGDPDGPLLALAFKVEHPGGRKLTWLRVYTGALARGDAALDPLTGVTERVGRLVQLHAGTTVEVDRLVAGDIGGAIGLGSAATGHTLCAPDRPVVLDAMRFAEPVLAVAVEPRRNDDQDRLSTALRRLTIEDPTFAVRRDDETGQTLMAGMGELHLQVLVERLAADHGVTVRTGRPEVAYRETITRPVRGLRHRVIRQTGGPGMFADITIDLEPTGSTEVDHLQVVDATTGGVVPGAYAAAVAAGARDALSMGPLGAGPLVGVRLVLTDGRTHEVDSNERSFRRAGAEALVLAAARGEPIRLEPVMEVHIASPDDHLGAVIGLVGGRRGRVIELGERAGRSLVVARAPLAELFGFSEALRSVSQGRATASLAPAGHQPG